MERCRLAITGICTRQEIVGCGEVPVVESKRLVNQRVVPTKWDRHAVEYTYQSTLCDGRKVEEKVVEHDEPNLSPGQVI